MTVRAIDSSSAVKFFSKEEGWEQLRKIFLEGTISINLLIKEVANALWKKVLMDEISIEDAQKIINDLAKNEVIKIVDQNKYLNEAFKIATKHKITVYDALFIALAKLESIELVTSDIKQAEIAKKEGIQVAIV